jgi:hypothetical protein
LLIQKKRVVFIRTATRSALWGGTPTPGGGGSAGLTRGYIINTALRCASRHAAFQTWGAGGNINTGRRQYQPGVRGGVYSTSLPARGNTRGFYTHRYAERVVGGGTVTPGGGGSAGLTRGYIINTALRCASRHAAFQTWGVRRQYINTVRVDTRCVGDGNAAWRLVAPRSGDYNVAYGKAGRAAAAIGMHIPPLPALRVAVRIKNCHFAQYY